MPSLKLIKNLHLLYIGADGTETYGISVRSLKSKEEIEDLGYVRDFDINDSLLLRNSGRMADELGMSLFDFFIMISSLGTK